MFWVNILYLSRGCSDYNSDFYLPVFSHFTHINRQMTNQRKIHGIQRLCDGHFADMVWVHLSH